MLTSECVECGGPVPFAADVIAGEIAQCPDCGIELEVLHRDPLELAVAPQIEEDWGE
jgi:alpha-aminoadipate/glutamate carrier protein LysW